jgi:prepilin-type N-terminal cleavage/methylation domain-containing protein
MKRSDSPASQGFTLIEILLASAAAALILAAIYGVFQHAIKLRDSATQRIRDLRLRSRAATVIRNDLRNAYISGGLFASIVQGDSAGTDEAVSNSNFPGYLKLTTTTAKDTPDDLYGDVQQVEYYIAKDTGTSAGGGGDLVRAVTRDLLNSTQPVPAADQQQILTGVQSLQVSFYDGTTWQTSWEFNTADNSTTGSTAATSSTNASSSGSNSETLPVAIRVDIQQVPPTAGATPPAPLEILVPWTTQPFTSPTPSPTASPS